MKFNGIDAESVYGTQLRVGADDELMKPPKKKKGFEYDPPDENGMVTDPDEVPVFERLTYSLPIVVLGNGQVDFFLKYNALRAFLTTAKEFPMDVPHLAKRFKVRYSEISSFTKVGMFSENGLIGCLFTLTLTDDYPTSNFLIP